jgi:ABC-type transporter Mla MlaB component
VDYFGARKNDLIKRTVNPLLEEGILLQEGETLRVSWEGVDEAFVDTGGENLLLEYIRRVQGERQKRKKLGPARAVLY